MRVVPDTNILISAFVFPGGTPETVYRAALEGRITLVTSPALLAEFGRVLTEKFGWESRMAEEAVSHVARASTVVRPSEAVHQIQADPADDRVLEAALEGEAGIIVSGDHHLLRFGEWRGVRVMNTAELVAELEGSGGRG